MYLNLQLEQRADTGELNRFPVSWRRAIERGLDRATELLARAVARNAQTPFGVQSTAAFGELARSVTREVSEETGRQVGRVFLAPPADQYGIFVEVGTRPHFPPPAAIEGWVRPRLGVGSDRQARELAFLIGRKIARAGTPGRFFFEQALADNQDRIVAILEEEVLHSAF